MDQANAVLLQGVSKQYGVGARAVPALTNITLAVPAGEFISVTGPSGCGKSTLLSLIAGLDTPDAGRVVVDGHDLSQLPDDARSDVRLHRIGLVFQSFNLFPAFSVEENVVWPLDFLGVPWKEAQARARDLLEQVGIDAAALGRRPAEISGGEQQRVAIARALVTEPRLLLADEPTGNLDSHAGQAILDLLSALNEEEKVTILMVTHDTHAAMIGHRTIRLRDGRIVQEARAGVAVSLRSGAEG